MLSKTVVALTAFFLSLQFGIQVALGSPCVVFDANFNLLVLGLGGKDWSLGSQDTWTGSGSASDITANGRPPFDGTGTTCYMAQFFNAIYVMNGDKANPDNIAVYDATAKSWTTQSTTATGSSFDPSSFVGILDHDTNVFFGLSGGTLVSLQMQQETAANSSAIQWNDVGRPSFSTTNYQPTMALAQNHIHFLDVPGSQPGTAQIFVIHFSFFQPDAQSYPVSGSGSPFPVAHGQAMGLFQPDGKGVQQEFAFIPDDGSQTYVVNVENNSTAVLAGPSDKSSSQFTTGVTAVVQLTSTGQLFFLPYTQGQASTNSAAAWTKVTLTGLPAVSSTSGSGSGNSSAGTTGTKGGSGTGTGSAPGSSGTTKPSSAQLTAPKGWSAVSFLVVAAIGYLL